LSGATFDLAENIPAGRLLPLAREKGHSWRHGLKQRVDSRATTLLGCCAGGWQLELTEAAEQHLPGEATQHDLFSPSITVKIISCLMFCIFFNYISFLFKE
jgi:hypothetical protein